MKYIVAVSGGVDSVVLLDMLARSGEHDLVVTHFEHGIRGESSRKDARFVQALAVKYGVKCEVGYGNLGESASEELARQKRYEFLKSVAKKYQGKLVTAHHQDDLIETIVINLMRGTGWRGLAVFGDAAIERPLLHMTKHDVYDYALHHELEWVEDETNLTNIYMRNRVRHRVAKLSTLERQQLLGLYEQQAALRTEIDQATSEFLVYSRYFFIMVNECVASELLRRLLLTQGKSLTRPQRSRLLLAIKTAKAGDKFQAGGGVTVRFTLREFIVN